MHHRNTSNIAVNSNTVSFLEHKIKMLQVGYEHQVWKCHQSIDLSHLRNLWLINKTLWWVAPGRLINLQGEPSMNERTKLSFLAVAPCWKLVTSCRNQSSSASGHSWAVASLGNSSFILNNKCYMKMQDFVSFGLCRKLQHNQSCSQT